MFFGSKPNKSFEILLPLCISCSSARGSKSESESEFNKSPSSFVPTEGFSDSIVFEIPLRGGTIGAKVFFGDDVSINN